MYVHVALVIHTSAVPNRGLCPNYTLRPGRACSYYDGRCCGTGCHHDRRFGLRGCSSDTFCRLPPFPRASFRAVWRPDTHRSANCAERGSKRWPLSALHSLSRPVLQPLQRPLLRLRLPPRPPLRPVREQAIAAPSLVAFPALTSTFTERRRE